jgi:UDP-N-acetyl-D-mannosaminuronate dehydrogenase
LAALTRYSRLAKADAVLVCVPTPLTRNRELDLRPLLDSTQALAEVLQSVSLEDALEDADLALILTAHPQVDHQLLAQRARLLVDPRGVTRTLGVTGAVRL